MLKRILIPYDTSKPSEKALRWVADLTNLIENKSAFEIVILHILPSIPATSLYIDRPVKNTEGRAVLFSEYIKTLYAEMKIHASEMLEGKKRDVEELTNTKVTVRTVVKIGESIVDEICSIAKKEKADLIVIGNVGLGGISKLKTLGSVSRGVSERTPCPVIIVH